MAQVISQVVEPGFLTVEITGIYPLGIVIREQPVDLLDLQINLSYRLELEVVSKEVIIEITGNKSFPTRELFLVKGIDAFQGYPGGEEAAVRYDRNRNTRFTDRAFNELLDVCACFHRCRINAYDDAALLESDLQLVRGV